MYKYRSKVLETSKIDINKCWLFLDILKKCDCRVSAYSGQFSNWGVHGLEPIIKPRRHTFLCPSHLFPMDVVQYCVLTWRDPYSLFLSPFLEDCWSRLVEHGADLFRIAGHNNQRWQGWCVWRVAGGERFQKVFNIRSVSVCFWQYRIDGPCDTMSFLLFSK